MIDDGGPAFPRELPDVKVDPDRALAMIREYSGMSLLDWFAGQCLIGLVAFERATPGMTKKEAGEKMDLMGLGCYEMAAKMLAARKQFMERKT